MEKKAAFDDASSTGFSKWDGETKTMQEYEQPALLLAKSIASQSQLNTIKDDTSGSVLLGYINDFDITKVETGDGRWIRDVYLPSAANVVAGKVVNVARYSGYGVTVHINGQSVNLNRGDSKFYISDGKGWQETSEAQVAEIIQHVSLRIAVSLLQRSSVTTTLSRHLTVIFSQRYMVRMALFISRLRQRA
ncbi:hypothetical protein [Vibrio owensii]|uniref:hypothetical protein n=1 Tax=Vibrio owensii TaxID=696485 RepID=UPI001F120E8E|nr:hypothetical protein [Vibrio owensii]